MPFSTLAQLRTAVEAKGYDYDDAILDDAINTAYREICAVRRWPFLGASGTLTVLANTASITAASLADLIALDSVSYTSSDNRAVRLRPVSVVEYQHITDDDTTTGEPEVWAYTAGAILVWPTPTRATALTVAYVKDAVDLSASGDAVLIPNQFTDAIVWGSVAALAYRQRDHAAHDRAWQRRDAAVERMVRIYGLDHRQGGRAVEETGFWDDMT